MKKLFIALIILLFSVSFVHAVTIASGSVTLANKRLSMVNGTAFVDFSAAGTLTAYLGQKLTITDSAGKKAVGYIKAAGTGETLGDEQITDGAFANGANWTYQGDGWSVADGVAHVVAAKSLMYQRSPAISTGTLELWSVEITNATEAYSFWFSDGYSPTASIAVSNGTKTAYSTVNAQGSAWNALQTLSGAVTADFDNFSRKQVLTPSATGVTITSTPNGATYNWTSIESGFNYNDASGYTYTIESVGGGGSLLLLGVGK